MASGEVREFKDAVVAASREILVVCHIIFLFMRGSRSSLVEYEISFSI